MNDEQLNKTATLIKCKVDGTRVAERKLVWLTVVVTSAVANAASQIKTR